MSAQRDTSVELILPPQPALSRVARLAASALASINGCTVDQIEDIKIAVSEIVIALIEHGAGDPVHLEYSINPNAFVITGKTTVREFDLTDPDLELCRVVLEGVGAAPRIDVVDGRATITAFVTTAAIDVR